MIHEQGSYIYRLFKANCQDTSRENAIFFQDVNLFLRTRMGAQLRGEERKGGGTSQGRIRIDSGGDSLKGQTAPPENPKNPGKRRLKKKHPTPTNSGQKPFFPIRLFFWRLRTRFLSTIAMWAMLRMATR